MSRKRKKGSGKPQPRVPQDPQVPADAVGPEGGEAPTDAVGSEAEGAPVGGVGSAEGADPADGADAAGAVPDALPPRPGHLCVAIAVVALEALALVAVAGACIVLAVTGGQLGTSLLALGVMFAILGVGMIAVTRSLWVMHRWARPAAIAWQVLQALFGVSTFQAGPLLGLAAIVPAVVFLYAIFQPRVVYAFEDAIAYHEAHPSAPAPPPKRW